MLLLTEVPGRDAWEVVYLGLTPAARGRGLGRAVIRHALEPARSHAPILELAVDLRNTPAVRLYRSTGFHPARSTARCTWRCSDRGSSAADPRPCSSGTSSPHRCRRNR